LPAITNFLEFLVDDEETTLVKLNHVCGDDRHIFSRMRIPKRRLPIFANPAKKKRK
jgi:hypothetical protein